MAMYPCLSLPPLSFPTLTGSIVTFNSQYAGLPLKSHKIALTATQSGSGTPSPDNKRSINGASALGIGATGKNLFSYNLPIRKGHWLGNVFNGTNEEVSLSSASGWCYIAVPVVENSTITISNMLSQGGTSGAFLSSLNVDDTVEFFLSGSQNGTKTVPSGAKYMCLVFYNLNSYYSSYPNAQLEVSESATTVEPFGTYITINLGGTYYVGEYDARTGVFTVTHGFVTYDSNNVPYMQIGTISGGVKTRVFIRQSGVSQDVSGVPDMLCNIANPVEVNAQYVGNEGISISVNANVNNQGFYIYDEDIQTLTEWQDYINNNSITVVYPLATPQTIQLPPCPIETLLGENNIWADTGDTTLQYPKFG